MSFCTCAKFLILRFQTIVAEMKKFISQRVEVSRFLVTAARPRVYEHPFDDAIGALSMVDYFGLISNQGVAGLHCFTQISLFDLPLQFFQEFLVDLRKIVHEIQRILDLMSDSGRK